MSCLPCHCLALSQYASLVSTHEDPRASGQYAPRRVRLPSGIEVVPSSEYQVRLGAAQEWTQLLQGPSPPWSHPVLRVWRDGLGHTRVAPNAELIVSADPSCPAARVAFFGQRFDAADIRVRSASLVYLVPGAYTAANRWRQGACLSTVALPWPPCPAPRRQRRPCLFLVPREVALGQAQLGPDLLGLLAGPWTWLGRSIMRSAGHWSPALATLDQGNRDGSWPFCNSSRIGRRRHSGAPWTSSVDAG